MRKLAALLVCVLLSTPAPARAQAAQDGRLIVTVVDTSGAIVPGAKVTVTALDDGARAAAFTPVTSTAKGVARIEGLLPGRYRIQAEFPGFDIGVLPEVRVRRGDNKHVLVLPLKKMEESVTVAQNAQAAAADPRGNAFKTVLTPRRSRTCRTIPPRWRSSCRISPAATPRSASTASPARRCRPRR